MFGSESDARLPLTAQTIGTDLAFARLLHFYNNLVERQQARMEWIARHPDYDSEDFALEEFGYQMSSTVNPFQSSFNPDDAEPELGEFFTVDAFIDLLEVSLSSYMATRYPSLD